VFKDVVFGARIAKHDRRVDAWDRGCTLGANGQCWTSPTMPFSATNPVSYRAGSTPAPWASRGCSCSCKAIRTNHRHPQRHQRRRSWPVASIHTPQNYYWPGAFRVRERDYSGYVMAKVGGDGWLGNFGVRLVDTQQDSFVNVNGQPDHHLGLRQLLRSPTSATLLRRATRDVNLTFDLKPNLFLRFYGSRDHLAARLQRPGRLGVADRREPDRQRRQPRP